jgi:hypothetical protein
MVSSNEGIEIFFRCRGGRFRAFHNKQYPLYFLSIQGGVKTVFLDILTRIAKLCTGGDNAKNMQDNPARQAVETRPEFAGR